LGSRELRRGRGVYGATVPMVLQYSAGYCSYKRGRGPPARAVRGAGNAGRGASPTAGKRESFSF
jgi:hypothetical protein